MPCTITLSQDFLDNFQQSEATAMMNLAAMSIIEMKKLAPFAKPSQYPGGYPGTPGTLVKSYNVEARGSTQESLRACLTQFVVTLRTILTLRQRDISSAQFRML
jgi:hypothetical protein